MGSSSSKIPPSRQVQTAYGPVVGRRLVHDCEKEVDAFQGIPYARPPVGELRFRKPEPPEPWTEPRQCLHFGPRGIQKDMFFWSKWGKLGPSSEDCLYLNVFTPCWEPPEGGFPIMVFIHGGGFVSDSTVKYGDLRVSQHLVTKGVVVVTAQYRLGYLGFWSTGDVACADNLGLWDQTAALRWVRDNGVAFGGDVNNVTLFGQSAGGVSVDLLTLSPHSRDLFHKVVPMAGNASCKWALHTNAVETCRSFATHTLGLDEAGHSQDFIDSLRGVDAQKFGTSLKPSGDSTKELQMEIGPRLDGEFFPKPLEALRKEALGKPRMVGCCQYEGLIFMMKMKPSVPLLEELIAQLVPETADDFKKHRCEMLKTLLEAGEDKEHLTRALAETYSDIFLNIGVQRYVLDWLKAGETAPIWMYSFDYCNPKSWGPLGWMFPFKGATHCTELAYIFGVGIVWDFAFNDQDYVMLNKTATLWSNFAKFSNPNGHLSDAPGVLGFEWQPATKENPQRHLSLAWEAHMEETYHGSRPLNWIKIATPEALLS